jgi:transposase
LTTKIHMAVDALGRPLKLILTPGQRGDAPLAPALLHGLSPRRVLADKAYDSNALRDLIAAMGAEAVSRAIRPVNKQSPTISKPTRSETPSSAASTSSSTSGA